MFKEVKFYVKSIIDCFKIHIMNIKNFDFNLLRVFAAVYRTRSVSRAAASIGLTQPAMSNALRRLREQCEDPLFVRSAGAMIPTALAHSLAPRLQEALQTIEACFADSATFHPESSSQVFRLLVSDVGEMVVLHRLVNALTERAPHVRLESLQVPHSDYAHMLRSGQADLAIGNIAFLQSGFYQQHLFDDHYLCIARKNHPTIQGSITLKRYLAQQHVISTAGNTDNLVDDALAERQQRRQVKLTVTHYHGSATIVARSDLIATVPENAVAGMTDLQKLALPFQIPAARIRQFWHRCGHRDPANKWLRTLIAELPLT
jgi:DNA-binding transcriptional LysR family regulator